MGCGHRRTSCYLAELYESRHRPERLSAESARIADAVADATASGTRIRYLHSVLVPADETVFHIFEADGPDAVEAVLRAAGLEAERICAAVTTAGRPILEPLC
jgi:hypothetical protein